MLPVVEMNARPPPPPEMRAFFWDVDYDTLEFDTHADAILARVLEYGRLVDVRWALAAYGPERIRAFFRDVAHPLIRDKRRMFWRAYFRAEEPWATPANLADELRRALDRRSNAPELGGVG